METRPTIITTIDRDGSFWTVLVDGDRLDTAATLSFVRDWIVGGTRRIQRQITPAILAALTTGSFESRDALLRRELQDGLARFPGARESRGRAARGPAARKDAPRRSSRESE
ncbi:MAG: hypothetical protein WED32_02775 [Patescibacteria group bacterium]